MSLGDFCQVSSTDLSPEWCARSLVSNAILGLLFKLSSAESGIGVQRKLVYVQWMGNDIGPVDLARARIIFPSVLHFVHRTTPTTADLEARALREVSKDSMLDRIRFVDAASNISAVCVNFGDRHTAVRFVFLDSGSRVRSETVMETRARPKSEAFKNFGKGQSKIRFGTHMPLLTLIMAWLLCCDVSCSHLDRHFSQV